MKGGCSPFHLTIVVQRIIITEVSAASVCHTAGLSTQKHAIFLNKLVTWYYQYLTKRLFICFQIILGLKAKFKGEKRRQGQALRAPLFRNLYPNS